LHHFVDVIALVVVPFDLFTTVEGEIVEINPHGNIIRQSILQVTLENISSDFTVVLGCDWLVLLKLVVGVGDGLIWSEQFLLQLGLMKVLFRDDEEFSYQIKKKNSS
jgi:hypothetical protein